MQAIAIRDAFVGGRIRLLVPPLGFYEVGNVLVSHYLDSAAERLAALAAFHLPEARPAAAWREQIIKLAAEHKVTFCDASYHALAVESDGIFVTADENTCARQAPTLTFRVLRVGLPGKPVAAPQADPDQGSAFDPLQFLQRAHAGHA